MYDSDAGFEGGIFWEELLAGGLVAGVAVAFGVVLVVGFEDVVGVEVSAVSLELVVILGSSVVFGERRPKTTTKMTTTTIKPPPTKYFILLFIIFFEMVIVYG